MEKVLKKFRHNRTGRIVEVLSEEEVMLSASPLVGHRSVLGAEGYTFYRFFKTPSVYFCSDSYFRRFYRPLNGIQGS